jgi:hypothetical protein
MRWLMIALVVSLVALLIAAAGAARHIYLHRAQLRSKPGQETDARPGPTGEMDPEP